MNRLPLILLLATTSFAADLPKIPVESIAVKKELISADDFEGAEPAKVWHKVVPNFAVEKGVLKGTQTRDVIIPAADGNRRSRPTPPCMAWRSPPRTASSSAGSNSRVRR
jgi:hypothetical protein